LSKEDSMETMRVFVASSKEGAPIAKKLRTLLLQELGGSAKVELWMHKFTLSDTAIESLEAVVNQADFAVVVMTPDDITVSRDKKEAAPRDNLVFELGLFIGALGRKRSIVARDGSQPLKLPSDMLGITYLSYTSAPPKELEASLSERCVELAGHITEHGLRPKWLAQGRASLKANADFCREIEGDWWERIIHKEGSALSFFTISVDPLTGNPVLEGASYNKDGEAWAEWESEMTRPYPNDGRIAYLWRGRHLSPEHANEKYHGYGMMDFRAPGVESSSAVTRGTGDFWDVNETRPGDTVFKPMDLRRVVNEKHRQIMTSGSDTEKRGLVLKVIKDW
jgi:hypothetical protein